MVGIGATGACYGGSTGVDVVGDVEDAGGGVVFGVDGVGVGGVVVTVGV